jgi:hypothetical protein
MPSIATIAVRLSLVVLALAAESGCSLMVQTQRADLANVHEVPPARLLGYTQPAPGMGRVEVTRDAGLMGGGCFLGLMYDGKLVARFDPEEHATFYFPVGDVALAAVPDPMGRGLCGTTMGIEPAVENHPVSTNKTTYLRMRIGAYRRPWLVDDKMHVSQ